MLWEAAVDVDVEEESVDDEDGWLEPLEVLELLDVLEPLSVPDESSPDPPEEMALALLSESITGAVYATPTARPRRFNASLRLRSGVFGLDVLVMPQFSSFAANPPTGPRSVRSGTSVGLWARQLFPCLTGFRYSRPVRPVAQTTNKSRFSSLQIADLSIKVNRGAVGSAETPISAPRHRPRYGRPGRSPPVRYLRAAGQSQRKRGRNARNGCARCVVV